MSNERKAKCGCWVVQEYGIWRVTASSFLCRLHKQGDAVSRRFEPDVRAGGERDA